MDFNSDALKSLVGKIAPTVALALGGPLAGGVVAALSQALLGKPDATPDELNNTLLSGNLTPEQIVQIKQIDADLKKHEADVGFQYKDLEYKTTVANLADVASARQRQVDLKDNMPQIITTVVFLLYAAEFAFFASGHMPTDEFTKALITRAFGTLDGIMITCVAFFMGTSKGSKNATAALTRIAEAPTPTPPPPTNS